MSATPNATASGRWRAEPTPPPKQALASLEPTHALGILDVLRCLAEEYAPVRRWDAELYQAIADTPALVDAPRPNLAAAHAKAHLHLTSREITRLLAVYPRVVIAGLVEGLTEALKPREL